MLTIDVAETIFFGCVLVGGGLLLLTVLLDDVLSGVLDFLHVDFDLGGVSLMPLVLGFVSMFGVGGLIGTRVFGLDGGRASFVGALAGMLGSLFVYLVFSFLRRAEAPDAFSLRDLVGQRGRVTVGIPAGRHGSVSLSYGGMTHDLTATADVDVRAGAAVLITDLAGTTLVVSPLADAVAAAPSRSEGGASDA